MLQRCCAAFAACLFGGCLALAQVKMAPEPERRTPEHVAAKLSAADRAIFDNLVKLELESLWAGVSEEGYQNCFINELTALKPGARMIGRARTVRYPPNRKDLRESCTPLGRS
jgi:hypothetical protein